MKKTKNNDGSVLVLVVLVIGVLSIMGTSVLSAALTNYKMKTTSSALKTNLYLVESGFEEIYQKIYNKVTEAATEAHKYTTENVINKYNDEKFNNTVQKISIKIEETPNYINEYKNDYPYITIAEDGEFVYDDIFIEDEANNIFKTQYINYIKNHLKSIVNEPVTGKVECNVDSKNITVYVKKKTGDTISALDTDLVFYNDKGKDKTSIFLQSEYNDGKAKRNAEVIVDIYVPNYREPYTVSVLGKQLKVNPLWTKSISTDGKIIVNGKTNIIGSVYADDNIEVNNDMTITRNLTTRSDFIINANNANIKTADIYCKNIDFQGQNISFTSTGNDEYKGIYVKDDMEMNNVKQSITLNNNYYGFSDGSDADDNRPDNSSGININSNDIGSSDEASRSFLAINGDLYLYGTSYINGLDTLYQTGESISLKGNYIAYSMPLLFGDYQEDNITFQYIDPLYLATEKNDEKMTVFDKREYFLEYYKELNEGKNIGKLNLKNVNISDDSTVVTLGDIISSNKEDKVAIGNITGTNYEDKFKMFKNIYTLKTEALGDKNISQVDGVSFPVDFINKCPKVSVANNVDFTHENIEYTGAGYSLIYRNDNSVLNLNLSGGETKYLFIITNGSVVINGDGNISGCVIAKGGVTINNKCNVIYNEKIVLNAFSDNDWLIEAFSKNEYANAEVRSFTISTIIENLNDDNKVTNIDYTDLLKFRNWKINYED